VGDARAQLDAVDALNPRAIGALAQRLARALGEGDPGAELGRRERDALVLLQPQRPLLRVRAVELLRAERPGGARTARRRLTGAACSELSYRVALVPTLERALPTSSWACSEE
jgi:hypothetical protein